MDMVFRRPLVRKLPLLTGGLLCLSLSATDVFAQGASGASCVANQVDYDIVYVRQDRTVTQYGQTRDLIWPEAVRPALTDPGADLMLLHPDCTEEVLVDGGIGAVTDPFVSFDAQWVYYSKFHDLVDINRQRALSKAGADIFRINLQTREIQQLTHGEFTPNTGAGIWDESNPLNGNGGTIHSLGYGIVNTGPAPLPGGKVIFTSNRNGFWPTKALSNPTMQIFVMDEDGSNVTQIAPMNIGSALHPTPLKDGRVMFSTLESQGLRDQRVWGMWTIYPDGRNWAPLISAFDYPKVFHFMTQNGNEDIVSVGYYNLNNSGFGTLLRQPVSPPIGQPAFHSAYRSESHSGDPTGNTLESRYSPYPKPTSHVHLPFKPWGMESLTPFSTPFDIPAQINATGEPGGKFTHPSAAPGNDLLVVWAPGKVNRRCGSNCESIDSGLYLIPQSQTIASQDELVKIKDDPNYNEAWPRAVVPYSAVHGVAEPVELPWLPNDGTLSAELPAGTPYGIIGSSSMYKRETAPGYVAGGYEAYEGLDPFNARKTDYSSNWHYQGADSGKYDDDEIWAVRIVAMEPNTHRSYNPYGISSSLDSYFYQFYNFANERLRILGEIPVRKFNADGTPVLDPEGNPDTSFAAKIPADTPFTFQTINRKGMVLNISQTWHQVRPGEVRTDCGGCHSHSQQPLAFDQTAAGQSGYSVWDLTKTTPLLTNETTDSRGDPTITVSNDSAVNVEFYRDIRPILQSKCVTCHTKNDPNPPAELVFDDLQFYSIARLNQGVKSITNAADKAVYALPGDYVRLAYDKWALWGLAPPAGINGQRYWLMTNASRYIRQFQGRRSLLMWKIYGERLDGWANEDLPTEAVPGDASSFPAGVSPALADLDYTGDIMPPPHSGMSLTEDEKMTFARWIDLGSPIDKGATAEGNSGSYGWFADDVRPTIALSLPRAGVSELAVDKIRIGLADAYTGLDMATFSVTADFEVNGRAAGAELADLATPTADGIYVIDLDQPIADVSDAHVYVSVKDQQGNITRVDRKFSVVVASP